MNYNTEYNSQITGLRGISVILVILFHLNEDIFFFGYLGVDIFFVISGYVITLTLHKEFVKKKQIKIINFYYRRIKRLLPSLIVCVFFTFFTYIIIADLIYFKEITKSAITSIFGFSNIYYILSNQDYFINNLENPFIHTWSLGIEEQYYLVYPFLLLAIYSVSKFFKINLFTLIFFLTSLSFFVTFIQYPLFDNFYFPLSRFWEISLGCLLFFFQRNKIKTHLQNILLTFQIIISSIILYFINYDVYKTILIINLLIFSIIYFDKNFLNIFLNNFYISYIGKISYSIYLFHFPIIVFCLYFFDGYSYYFIALILIFLISFLNYHLVENTFINLKFNFSLYKYFNLTFIIISIFFLYSYYDDNKKFKSSINRFLYNFEITAFKYNLNTKDNYMYLKNTTNIENYSFKNIDLRNCSAQRIMPKEFYYENCYINNKTDNLIHVIGDSQAEQIVPMLLENNSEFDYLITPMLGATFFPNLYYEYKNQLVNHKTKINTHYINLISEILDENYIKYKNRIILIAGRTGFALNNFNFFNSDTKSIDNDKLKSIVFNNFERLIKKNNINTKFILIPDIPVPSLTLAECVKNIKNPINYKNECKFDISKFTNERFSIDNIYKQLFLNNMNVFLFDFKDYNCENNLCMYFYEPYKPIYSRKNHFSVEYSIYMSSNFFKFVNKIK